MSPVRLSFLVALAIVLAQAVTAGGQPPGPSTSTADWRPPGVDRVRSRLSAWLDARQVDAPTRAKVEQLWDDESDSSADGDWLGRLARSFALVDSDARKLVGLCSQAPKTPVLPDQTWLQDQNTPPWMADNMRLFYGRWLAQHRLFDEAMEQLADLEPAGVIDPACLLFYQGVVHHRLLGREAGLKAIEKLLRGAEQSPQRYRAVARLIQADLVQLEEDSLDHIARRMEDIERRLDLGRAGPTVRRIEDGVIQSLDKLIKQLQQQQQSAAGAGSVQPSRPAQDSRILGGKGPGEVTKRAIGTKSGWGNMPPKQREEALQQISREFPAHYRDVIEQYFRKLASQWSEKE